MLIRSQRALTACQKQHSNLQFTGHCTKILHYRMRKSTNQHNMNILIY